MSEDKQPTKHSATWVVSLIALPLLYVLSWGPMEGLCNNGTISEAAWPLVNKFYQPLIWLHDNTPLGKPLEAYNAWWIKVLYKP